MTQIMDLETEHEALKQQVLVLKQEHDRFHELGDTGAAHRQHLEKLRLTINELEIHGEKLKRLRKST
jgi:uncharacterized protein YlxW (UPF0749 family)